MYLSSRGVTMDQVGLSDVSKKGPVNTSVHFAAKQKCHFKIINYIVKT